MHKQMLMNTHKLMYKQEKKRCNSSLILKVAASDNICEVALRSWKNTSTTGLDANINKHL